jgi:hypothetical protein
MPEEGRFATCIVAKGILRKLHGLRIQRNYCVGTTATHYLPISMSVLDSRLVPELPFFLVCSTVTRRKILEYGCLLNDAAVG